MKRREGDWMATRFGVKFYPLDPKSSEILPEDIAHALSNICRFGGHTKKFYSVAQHCVLVAQWITMNGGSREESAGGLLHDASEAYLGDVISPLKSFFPAYKVVEERAQEAIFKRFNLPVKMPAIVKKADQVILACEVRDLIPMGADFSLDEKPDPKIERIQPRLPETAAFMWTEMFRLLVSKELAHV
jgi:uncharacterized protein